MCLRLIRTLLGRLNRKHQHRLQRLLLLLPRRCRLPLRHLILRILQLPLQQPRHLLQPLRQKWPQQPPTLLLLQFRLPFWSDATTPTELEAQLFLPSSPKTSSLSSTPLSSSSPALATATSMPTIWSKRALRPFSLLISLIDKSRKIQPVIAATTSSTCNPSNRASYSP